MKKLLPIIGLIMLTACNDTPQITGTWTQPVPGMENMTQGFVLNTDGTAQSVNMATLEYETWSRDGDELVMTGNSIGNGQTIEFTQIYTIESLDDNALILRDGDITYKYTRE